MGNSEREAESGLSGRTFRRYGKIDEIRGYTLISMILYHFLWDLRFIAGFKIDWYTQLPGRIWQASICFVFIFISGFCLSLSRNSLKRGITVFVSGILVTVVTLVFMPENRVVFGILTLIGSCMIIMSFVRKIDTKNNIACFVTMMLLFILFFNLSRGKIGIGSLFYKLPESLYEGYFMTYLGFPFRSFYSTDYFPLMPWIFLFAAGYFAYRIAENRSWLKKLGGESSGSISFIGRNTLIIYLFHQIVLYGLTCLLMMLYGNA